MDTLRTSDTSHLFNTLNAVTCTTVSASIPPKSKERIERFLSPYTFEYRVNPVIHRPYLQDSECFATISQGCEVSGGHPPAIRENSSLDVAQNIGVNSSTPSTQLTSPSDAFTDWLDTPTTSSSTNTSPFSAVTDSFTKREGTRFTCCHCPEVFGRRCDLNKHINRIHNKRAKCPYEGCTQKPFGFEADLQRHIAAKHNTEGKAAVRCTIHGCTEEFSRRDNMLRHMKKRHPGIST